MIALMSNPIASFVVGFISLVIGVVSLTISIRSLNKISSVETAVLKAKRQLTLQWLVTENKQALTDAHIRIAQATTPDAFIHVMDPLWPVLTRIENMEQGKYDDISNIYEEYSEWYYDKSLDQLQVLKRKVTTLLSKLLNDMDQGGLE